MTNRIIIARFIPVFLLLLLVTAVPNLIVATAMWSNEGLKTEWITDHKWLKSLFGLFQAMLDRMVTIGVIYQRPISSHLSF